MRKYATALILVFGGVGLASLLGGCGGSEGTDGTAVMSPTEAKVVVGGYTFGAKANSLNHAFYKTGPATAAQQYVGWGIAAGGTVTFRFVDGGLVKGIKTLRGEKEFRVSGEAPWKERAWVAQDSTGNIHVLKLQTNDTPTRTWEPAQLMGVAAGGPACLYLPRAKLLTLNRVWYEYEPGTSIKCQQYKVIGLNLKWRGGTGMVKVRKIADENGDGVFNPDPAGPDDRNDIYFQPQGKGDYGIQYYFNPDGGAVKS